MGQYGSEVINCPFYLWHDGQTCFLTCEGMLSGSSIKSHFENGKAMRGRYKNTAPEIISFVPGLGCCLRGSTENDGKVEK